MLISKKNRFLCTILCMILLIFLLSALAPEKAWAAAVYPPPGSTIAADGRSGTSGDCRWVLDDNGVLTISPKTGLSSGKLAESRFWGWDPQAIDYANAYFSWGVAEYYSDVTVKHVVIGPGVIAGKDISHMFSDLTMVETIDLSGLDTSGAENMSYLFYNLTRLKSIEFGDSLSNASATNMSYAFSRCSSLETADLSKFPANGNLSYMFSGCNLTGVNASLLRTIDPTNMQGMFQDCRTLTGLDMSGYNTEHVISTSGMFSGCSNLSNVVFGNQAFSSGNLTDMSSMFYGCSALTALDLSGFNTSAVTSMSGTFRGGSGLTSLDLSTFVTPQLKNTSSMFNGCRGLEVLDIRNLDTSGTTSMSSMFSGVSKLKAICIGSNTFARSPGSSGLGTGTWVRYATLGGSPVYPGEKVSGVYNVTGDTETTPNGWWKPQNTIAPNESDFQLTYISEEGEQENEWVLSDDGETWSYTFQVASDLLPYYIWEVDPIPEGYDGDYVIGNPAYYSVTEGTAPVTITNVKEGSFGSLEIGKVVSGTSTDRSFLFHVVLRDENGAPLSGSAAFGDVVFVEGEAVVALADGESALMTDIPVGYQFTVWEETTNGYAVIEPAGGEISGTVTREGRLITFTNQLIPPPANGGFALTKEVTGRFGDEGTYRFLIAFTKLFSGATYFYDTPEGRYSFESDETGAAFVDVTLNGYETAIFTGLPVGCEYIITEFGGGGYTASYTISPDGNVVTSSGSAKAGEDLSTLPETVDANETTMVTFVNELHEKKNVHVEKWLDEDYVQVEPDIWEAVERPDISFDFTITFSKLEPNTYYSAVRTTYDEMTDSYMNEESIGRFRSDEEGNLEWNFRLKHYQRVTFQDLPVGAVFQVKELANAYRTSYDVSHGYDYVGGAWNETPNKDLTTDQLTVDDGAEYTVFFYNSIDRLTEVTVKKVWDDEGNMNGVRPPSIKVQLYREYNGGEPEPYGEPVILTQEQNASADDPNTWSYTWKDLEAEAVEWVYDEEVGDFPEWYMYEYSVVEEEVIGYDTVNHGATVKETDKGYSFEIVIDNKLHEYELLLEKVDQDNGTIGIAGAEFSLYPSDYLNADGTVNAEVESLGEFVSAVDSNGAPIPISLGTRAVGTYYLVETKAPEHYESLSAPLKLTIVKNGTATLEQEGEETAAVVDPDNKTVLFTVTNKHHYNFELVKVDQDNNTIGVKGAVFRLYPSDYIKADGTVDTSVDDLGKFTSDVGENGAPKAIELGEYPAGTYYLVETKAPSNYVKLTSPVKLTVLEDGTATMEIGGSTTNAAVNAETKTVTFTVPNPQGANLPGVGGSGTELFYLAGFSLVLLGGAALLVSRKKRETERVRSERP